ncbi:MAG TPA: peptidase C45, partial [Agriterribacter sp.]|nr:peptidase C45 [Agriterribacter sp.]
ESFLVASARDNKAVIIEKTPDTLDVYDPHTDRILCANHFQGDVLAGTESNREQVSESASAYRFQRLTELIERNGKNNVQKTVDILRDRRGLHDRNIGMGNEKALNQLIAHHAVVFEPQKLLVWVSTSPWQLGEFVAYDLKKVFAIRDLQENHEIYDTTLTIAADSFLLTAQYKNFEKYRRYKHDMAEGAALNPDSLVASNPEFYNSFVLAGDYCFKHDEFDLALKYYNQALTREIATKAEEAYIRKQIANIKKQL